MPADLVFRNGPVHTMDAGNAVATAVAIRDGRIIAVGDDADVAPLIDANTSVVDLAGRALLPGFQDAHVHLVSAGLTMINCDLHVADDAEGALAVIAEYAAAH